MHIQFPFFKAHKAKTAQPSAADEQAIRRAQLERRAMDDAAFYAQQLQSLIQAVSSIQRQWAGLLQMDSRPCPGAFR